VEVAEGLTRILRAQGDGRGDLIAILQEVQAEFGYLPKEALLGVAKFLQIPESLVYSVATFYNQFRLTPLGRRPIKVCMGTACHLSGGELVLEAVQRELDVDLGGLTSDGEFSLDRVACIGCCAIAPAMVIGDAVYPKMTPWKVVEVLTTIKSEIQEANKGD